MESRKACSSSTLRWDDRAARCRLRSARGNPRARSKRRPARDPFWEKGIAWSSRSRAKACGNKRRGLSNPQGLRSFERRRFKQTTRVDGGPVDERRRREPRAHRFQAAESTSVVEQPSSFAGWRSVASLGCYGSKVAERFVSPTTDKPSRHFSSESDPVVTTRGARREKRRGLQPIAAGDSSLPRLRHQRNAPENATSGMGITQPLLVLSARTSFSPPQEGGLGLRTDQRRAARFLRTAGASLRREGNSTEATSIEREDHPLPGVPVCRK